MRRMTPSEMKVVRALVAVAWADGKVAQPEKNVIEGLLAGFDASEAEEAEILEYARKRRTLDDIPIAELEEEERELLLANAALLTHADGEQSESEKELLDQITRRLAIPPDEVERILESARDGAIQLGSRALQEID
jgi:tellurite resistance protein